ncbi:3-(3-hydroxy-phenyl)propionate/3-hydroxycinnamic acid hydroxylase [Fusarium sp. LHS14.1]|nr:3-(3-hydroxy-phenyl)propionate/3-hydroxycinnamic acid hydroxylase [Fusarium sp. LHS14.1]
MVNTDVIIVGAGPSGLALAIALAARKVKSIVLEKNHEICTDPRAIAMAGDSPRIVNLLGVNRSRLEEMGQVMTCVHFHQNIFTSKPFASIEHDRDWLEQALPPAFVLLQPELEKELRRSIQTSEYAELRLNCTVTGIREVDHGVYATYQREDGETMEIQGKHLVGADGKRGYVRKGYLEARGIQQLPGLYKYEATWIAANLRITLPTPTSHPSFPLWKLGYQPEQLWDIFWPGGFHFCTHSTMPIATGRFGPRQQKYWRFEYELPLNYMPHDLEEHLKDQMAAHITIPGHLFSHKGMKLDEPVSFPWDCVEVLRCAPANFSQKVVNRWFHGSVSLIGDAAHVFPPFGAQGIASGIRDALGLSWRLALLCDPHSCFSTPEHRDILLEGWSRERRKGVDISSIQTARSGNILLSKSGCLVGFLKIFCGVLDLLPSVRDRMLRLNFDESDGHRGVDGGFFLEKEGGGFKTAQVCLKTTSGLTQLSDEVFWGRSGVLTLLLLRHPDEEEAVGIKEALDEASLPPYFLSKEVLELCDGTPSDGIEFPSYLKANRFFLGTEEDAVRTMAQRLMPHYNPSAFRDRFQTATRYALIRPDFIVFSQARSPKELGLQLHAALQIMEPSVKE